MHVPRAMRSVVVAPAAHARHGLLGVVVAHPFRGGLRNFKSHCFGTGVGSKTHVSPIQRFSDAT
jgi:hypothetical protein